VPFIALRWAATTRRWADKPFDFRHAIICQEQAQGVEQVVHRHRAVLHDDLRVDLADGPSAQIDAEPSRKAPEVLSYASIPCSAFGRSNINKSERSGNGWIGYQDGTEQLAAHIAFADQI
jgi:hypothetical protein